MSKKEVKKIDLLKPSQRAHGEILSKDLSNLLNVARERYEHMQYGRKSNQYYIEHALNGVFNILQHRGIFDTLENGDKLLKLCLLSYIPHDLNKIPEYESFKSSKKWSQSTVQRELEALNEKGDLDNFFPMWKDYLPDITAIIDGHSTIYHHQAKTLFMNNYETYDS